MTRQRDWFVQGVLGFIYGGVIAAELWFMPWPAGVLAAGYTCLWWYLTIWRD